MSLPEDDLKDFFAGLRAEDQRVPPPTFAPLTWSKPRREVWRLALPLGLAASVLLLLLLYRPASNSSPNSSPNSVLVISLEARQEPGTESLLSAPEDPVFSWESPSASLIADF